MVQPSRMQVTTSCRMRRDGWWKSTSLVTTVRDPRLGGEVGKLVQAKLVARPAAERQRHMRPVAEDRRHAPELRGARRVRQVRDEHADQAFRVKGDVLPAEDAVGLAAAPLAERQQPAQPGIGRPVGRIDQERGAIGQIEPAADDQPDAGRLGRLMGADDAGEAVAVGDRQRLDAAERRPGRTAPRRSWRRAGRRSARRTAARRISSEDAVQEPAMRSRSGILAVAGRGTARSAAPASSSTWK